MKKLILKGAIVITVFFMALFTISNVMNKGNTDMTTEMAKAKLPVVTMQYGGRDVNELHGYAEAMEVNYMRESITPLIGGRKASFQIDTYGRTVTGLAFEVRSLDGQRLIEDTVIEEYEEKDGVISATIGIKDLIENNKEYMLVLLVTVDGSSQIRYYTRIIFAEDYFTNEKIDYILDFSNKTFDKEAAKELTKYLESNSEGDNTTFGQVNIHSSFSQVTWGDLGVERLSEPQILIKELSSQTGSFLLKYYVGIEEGKTTNYYQIEEYYRVRYTTDRMYLLDFERSMNRIFDRDGEVFGNGSIYLGILGEALEMKESDDGNVIAFVNENRLFGYNVVEHKLAVLFSFYDKDNLDARTLYDQNSIKILNVDEGGNVTFMVYGYMNRGNHEGKAGILVSYYDSSVNTTEELLYIPYYKSPELLLAEVEQLSYINRMGTIYLMLDNEIYGINARNRSCEVLVQDLKEGCYQVSDSNLMVVWQTENRLYEGSELILMNLNTGSRTSIKAGSGEAIAPIGFMGEDLIYGIARKEDIVLDNTGNVIFPMYCVKIQNETDGVLKTYEQENVYVTAGNVVENQIILNRVEKNADGEYAVIIDDQIMNAEVAKKTQNTVSVVAIDTFQKVTQIDLKQEVQRGAVMLLTPKDVLFEGNRNIELKKNVSQSERYYVYGKGKVQGIFMDVGNAVNLAYDVAGVVVNDAGSYVWTRGSRSTKNQIMAIQGERMTEERSSLAVCLETMLTFEGISRNCAYLLENGDTVFQILDANMENVQILDLTGCSLDAVLYYVNQDIPVLVMLEDEEAVLLIGFNEKNTVVMNPETGTVYKVGMNDSKEWFERSGNKFITYIRNES